MYVAMKTETFAKLFFLISFTGLIMYAVLAFYTFHTAYTTVADLEKYNQNYPIADMNPKVDRFYTDLKYILIWTTPEYFQNPLGEGQGPFVKYDCPYYNCYLTTKKDLLNGDYKNFDAVFMDINLLRKWKKMTLPRSRSQTQKYIFHGMRSSDETPICTINADNYFNWTWSYKLSSDIVTPFIEVRDYEGNQIAPRVNVQWKKDMTKISDVEKEKMKTKTKAVVWVMNSCSTRTNRMVFVKQLRDALREHSLELDIYGCKMFTCPGNDCMKLVERDYYYYLAYEDSNAEDYVTEEVLKAYHHNAVPIVKGGANYKQ
ncbi:alpha-(1,3)-fucosyltransferase C-like [Ostrinia nubilalis]|uniref:alpha-(1,3)-fucosyltransferase C-like n=1 Tax=Ostrinia nubilalis TaxID=29057 RepID=UPI003082561B